jgi:hypothetical protein
MDVRIRKFAKTSCNNICSNNVKLRIREVLPVVMIADLIAAGLQSGWRVLRSPTAPATCGQDIDVPDSVMKGDLRLSKSKSVGLIASLKAAIMFTPGAVISGCTCRNEVDF